MMAIPDHVGAFRAEHRARHIGPRYRGWLHFGTTTVGALAAIIVAVVMVDDPTPLELLAVPISFLITNFGEYLGHRGPMHHRRRGMTILFERHARQHHRFYTHDAMAAESPRDFQMVLFPPVMLVFFLGMLAFPIGALLHYAISPNVGWLFGATAMTYFLTYEWLHFAYHLPPDGWVGRRRLVQVLRRHHTHHHDQRRMTHTNFNITFPIADWVFGTIDRPETSGIDQGVGAAEPLPAAASSAGGASE
jgi:hypothetical protein